METSFSDSDRNARPSLLPTILLGTATVAVLDITNAITFWALYKGVKPGRIFQHVASGLLGKQSFDLGMSSVWLGMLIHVFVACGVTTVYCFACLVQPVLLRKPILSGCIYGAVVYGVMNFVVIPLSRVTRGPFRWYGFLDDFAGHILLIGLPLALIAAWSARRHGETNAQRMP